MSAQVGYVGHHADHLVTPVEGNQALPGVGRSVDVGAKGDAPAALRRAAAHHHHRDDGRARPAADYNSMQASVRQRSATAASEFLASYTLGERHHQQPRLLRRVRRHGAAGRDQRDRGRLLAEHLRSRGRVGTGVPRRPAQLHLVGAPYELPFGQGTAATAASWPGAIDAILGGWGLGGIFQARCGLPITVIDGRAPSLQGERGSERPNCVGDRKPTDQSHRRNGSTSTRSRRRRSARLAIARSGSRARQATPTSTACCRSDSRSAARATPSSGSRRSTS